LMMSEAAAGEPAISTGAVAGTTSSSPPAATVSMGDDDNAAEEPEVIVRPPGLRAPGDVSLSKEMGMTHFALNQVHDVPHREREDIDKV
jgi:hypothetical protein